MGIFNIESFWVKEYPKLYRMFFCLFCLFVFCTSFGEVFSARDLRLLGFVTFKNIGFGNHTGRFLFFFIPLGIFLGYKKILSRGTPTSYEKLAGIYLLFLLLQLFWAHYPNRAYRGPKNFVFCLLCYGTLQILLQSKKDFIRVILFFLLGGILVGAVNFYHYYWLGMKLLMWHWTWKSFLSSFLALNFALLLFFSIHLKKGKFLFALTVAGLLLLYFTLLPMDCRNTYIALPVSLLITGGFYQRKILPYVLVGSLISALLIFTVYKEGPGKRMARVFKASPSLPSKTKSSSGAKPGITLALFKEQSFSNRLNKLWPAAIDMMIQSRGMGIGCNSFSKHLQEEYSQKYTVTYQDSDAHNSFLHIGAGLGILGIGFYLAFILLFFAYIVKNLSVISDPFLGAFNLAIFCWFICHLLEGMTAYYYFKERYVLVVALMVSLVLKSRELALKEDQNR